MAEVTEEIKKLGTFKERAERILSAAFSGLHHADGKIKWSDNGEQNQCCEVITYQEFSTYDFDRLSRLVIMAHEECCRVTIKPASPKYLRIIIWPRNCREEGESFYYRHPSIEEATARVRKEWGFHGPL